MGAANSLLLGTTPDRFRHHRRGELRGTAMELQLNDTNLDELKDRIRTLAANPTDDTRRVTVYCPRTSPDWNSEPVRTFFDELSRLPHLENIKLRRLGVDEQVLFPLGLLTMLLDQCKGQLRSLTLERMCFEGNVEALSDFARAIGEQTCLQNFFLEFGSFPRDTRSTCTLDAVVSALARVNTLQYVYLNPRPEAMGKLAPESLADLLSSPSLLSFTLDGFVLNTECLQKMTTALQDNQQLKDLDIGLLEPNKHASGFATMLKTNQCLQNISIRISNIFTEGDNLIEGAMMIVANAILARKLCERMERDFAAVLEENTCLRSLHLSGITGEARSKIEMYLRLNARGRQRLLQDFEQVTREEWVDVLVESTHEVDDLFYFLRMNPFLCEKCVTAVSLAHNHKSTDSKVAAATKAPSEQNILVSNWVEVPNSAWPPKPTPAAATGASLKQDTDSGHLQVAAKAPAKQDDSTEQKVSAASSEQDDTELFLTAVRARAESSPLPQPGIKRQRRS